MTSPKIDIETSYLPQDLQFRIVPFEDKVDYNSLQLHRHNYLEIFFFNQGGGTHLIDFKEYKIKSKQLHFVFPNQIHLVKRHDDAHGYVILFKADFLQIQVGNPMQEFYSKFFNNPILSPDSEQSQTLLNIFTLLKNEYQSKDEVFNNAMVKYYLNAFLIQCLRYQKRDQGQVNLLDEDHQICNQFLNLVEQHYTEQLSLIHYQEQLNLSYKKLSSATQNVFGKSPKEMLGERLNLEIKRKLMYSNDSIKEIAFEFNFNEPSHLTKFFNRLNDNQSPQDFRTIWEKKYKSNPN